MSHSFSLLGWNQSQRGAGYLFGSTVVKKFLSTNNFEHITRAHQLCMDGYQVLFDDQLSTVWRWFFSSTSFFLLPFLTVHLIIVIVVEILQV